MEERDFEILQGKACGGKHKYLATVFNLSTREIGQRLAYVCEEFGKKTIMGAIRQAMLNKQIKGPELSLVPVPIRKLNSTEKKILDFLLADATTSEIADELQISPHNVCVHINRINHKYIVHSRAHLVAMVTKLEMMTQQERDR